MLRCNQVTELTTDYLEDALPMRRRVAVRWHLAICSFCRRHLRQVRATIALLHAIPPARVSPEREQALLAEMHRALPPSSPQSG